MRGPFGIQPISLRLPIVPPIGPVKELQPLSWKRMREIVHALVNLTLFASCSAKLNHSLTWSLAASTKES